MGVSLFSNPIREVFETQKTDATLIFSDLSHSDVGYLPGSNPQSSLTKNQETQPFEKIFFGQSFEHLSIEMSIGLVSDIDLNRHFDTILSHIHPSHFYF
ncbi:hypothetical protein [Algoriphagus hitonicola]|uniref:Uncharacterized protein n=1 Tax=Algoriphagus hitonicola TaxID=435880 RepID=A0A1I2U276_9BACT|nr:hypothetical protein [Algoriphagus hitonicola]SFG71250.1 hypothetical protein SAMN04487988_1076 [Algoriphagus hitonicola]